MVIREAGILFRGYNLVNEKYHSTGSNIDKDLRSGMLTAIINFCENAFSVENVEYLESDKYSIAFRKSKIKSAKSTSMEPLVSYAILDKEKNVDRYIHKIIQPLLEKVNVEFKAQHNGKNLAEISQFNPFKRNLREIFGAQIKTLDQKLNKLFY